MARVRQKDTDIERRLGRALWAAGFRYRKQARLPGRPDFVLTRYRIAIFCDSHFWHGYMWEERGQYQVRKRPDFWKRKIERNMQRDRDVNHALDDLGWTVIRFWEHEILRDVGRCVATVEVATNKATAQADARAGPRSRPNPAGPEPAAPTI